MTRPVIKIITLVLMTCVPFSSVMADTLYMVQPGTMGTTYPGTYPGNSFPSITYPPLTMMPITPPMVIMPVLPSYPTYSHPVYPPFIWIHPEHHHDHDSHERRHR